MRHFYFAAAISLLSLNSWAIKLSDYTPYKFEPLFTNPVCKTYEYDRPVVTNSGKTITSKPVNVYCKQADEAESVKRKDSPQYRLKEWIGDKNTKEIFMAYLSFSSKNIKDALCEAVSNGLKLSMVLDQGEDPATPKTNPDAESLKKCGKEGLVTVTYRGTTGGLGYAHNKILIVNPNSDKEVKIVFSSGNMSGGTSINHENWNFVTTSPKSYFAQAHVCVVNAMIRSGDTKQNFAKDLNNCRSSISAKPESDIQTFFSPIDTKKTIAAINEGGNKSKLIEGMSHRLSGEFARAIQTFMSQGKPVKFILDDDIYWSVKRREDIGRNTSIEAFKIYRDLINKGMETRFLQTNQNVFQLQHNKFFVFTFEDGGGAVFNGAGNFTSAALGKNFENFYYITIPEVVEAYKAQYKKYFYEMASTEKDMPRDYLLP